MRLYSHHRSTIENIYSEFINDQSIIAILLGGSIAHGYARKNSDVDIIFIVTNEEYIHRQDTNSLLYFNRELCTYSDGYVDGKFVNLEYLLKVKENGNEPTRYAFKDATFIFCKDEALKHIIEEISVFNISLKEDHTNRFYAQILAWKWFYSEGVKHNNQYLINIAISNFCLFSCRLILNHNNILFPYHKWMLKEVERAKFKPKNMIKNIDRLLRYRKGYVLEQIYKDIKTMGICDFDETKWSTYFHKDVETTWLSHESYIADV
jgi:predicted nucleotidyltransferase